MKTSSQWLNYYAASLTDGDMFDVQPKDWEAGYFFNAIEALDDSNKLSSIFRDLNKRRATKTNQKEGDEDTLPYVNVFISPFFISRQVERGRGVNTQRTFPFWIPAKLNSDGLLLPPDNQFIPWVLRTSLDPILLGRNEIPTIGHVNEVTQELNIFNFEYNSWTEYWDSCEQFFRKLTKSDFCSYSLDDAIVTHNVCLIAGKTNTIASHILNTYTDLKKKYPSLLNEVLSNQYRTQIDVLPTEELFLTNGHYGQYSNSFALSFSQRQSLLSFISEDQANANNVLAVNGPPGTGKTTLLQSVIANEMVTAAIKGREPIKIVASSANNQAITNILESFNNSKGLERWIPNLNSLGTYLTSNKEDNNYQIISAGFKGLEGFYFENLESEDVSIASIKDFYLSKYRKFVANEEYISIKDIANSLRKKLNSKTSEIDSYLNTLSEIAKLEQMYFPLSELENINEEIKKLKGEQTTAENEIESFTQYKNEVFDTFFQENKLSFFSKLSSSSQKSYKNKVALFLATSPYTELSKLDSQDAAEEALVTIIHKLKDKTSELKELIKSKEQLLQKLEIAKLKQEETEKVLDNLWNKFLGKQSAKSQEIHKSNLESVSKEEKVNIILDLTLRYECFELAVHYWEARWILTQEEDKLTNTKGRKSRIDVFRRMSYLTPLFVSTFHTLPSFCVSSFKSDEIWLQKPIYELFDILIVDEAGQVTPEIGVPALSFAKRALIVGDIYQIEPVWRVTYPRVDSGNLAEAGLLEDHTFDELDTKGILASSGSFMNLAQNASNYRVAENLGGTMLTEHRRCVNQLVEYCNRYIYGGLLHPMVGDLEYNSFVSGNDKLSIPPFAYINIRGYSEKHSGSVRNTQEAIAVAKWVKKYEHHIVNFYKEEAKKKDRSTNITIKDCLAVVTPFSAQRTTILRELRKLGLEDGIVVGTVHALQGAEIPMVIFSPTYGINHGDNPLFFDNGYNMFNVALTRAKHHFIIIGNMRLFKPMAVKKPSGGLAEFLFSNPLNELPSSYLLEDINIPSDLRVDTLERHQLCLSSAFVKAKRRVIVVSPFISIHALRADNLLPKIEECVEKNIEVIVYTDNCLDLINGQLKPSSKEGREALEASGAELRILNGIHNKALVIDENVLIEGSFNWLSAVRDKNNIHYRYEVSQIIMKDEAKRQIVQLLKELESVE